MSTYMGWFCPSANRFFVACGLMLLQCAWEPVGCFWGAHAGSVTEFKKLGYRQLSESSEGQNYIFESEFLELRQIDKIHASSTIILQRKQCCFFPVESQLKCPTQCLDTCFCHFMQRDHWIRRLLVTERDITEVKIYAQSSM